MAGQRRFEITWTENGDRGGDAPETVAADTYEDSGTFIDFLNTVGKASSRAHCSASGRATYKRSGSSLMTPDEETDPYPALLHRVATNHPDQGGEYRKAMAELQVQLVKDQIASAKRIADATESTARSLSRATWTLSIVTAVLAIATVVLVVVTARHGG